MSKATIILCIVFAFPAAASAQMSPFEYSRRAVANMKAQAAARKAASNRQRAARIAAKRKTSFTEAKEYPNEYWCTLESLNQWIKKAESDLRKRYEIETGDDLTTAIESINAELALMALKEVPTHREYHQKGRNVETVNKEGNTTTTDFEKRYTSGYEVKFDAQSYETPVLTGCMWFRNWKVGDSTRYAAFLKFEGPRKVYLMDEFYQVFDVDKSKLSEDDRKQLTAIKRQRHLFDSGDDPEPVDANVWTRGESFKTVHIQ